jgi:predicted CXXCH cytochrome family protein
LTVEPKKLCFSCHEITEQELEKFEFVHEPVKGDCVVCHSPHGGDNSKMLIAKAPDLCYPCHEDIKDMAENSVVKHSVVKSEGGCLKCHTPHASSIQYGLKAAPMDLCMGCHDKAVGISKDEILKAFSGEIKGMKFMHGPVGEKNCKGCHTPHGSKNFRLLAKDYPPQFYSSFEVENYDLCFSCHPKDLVLNAETKDLTDFRNGRSNLHFLHVNKDTRGRTCRSCHAVHASNREKHLRESVPYGSWELPINFSKTATGGRCEPGCHIPKDYDRKKPVEY